MPPHDERPRDSSLGIVLWRLDSLDRNVSRLVTLDKHDALSRRVDALEEENRETDKWRNNLVAGIVVAFSGSAFAVIMTVIGG